MYIIKGSFFKKMAKGSDGMSVRKCIQFALLGLLLAWGQTCCAQSEYAWSTVPFGGGGYITGIVTHPADPELVYARTDVSGAYRWENGKWVSMTEQFTEKNFYGVAGLAVDPGDPDTVYMAVGKYPDQPCDVLKSDDRGVSWSSCSFPQTFSANGDLRAFGECIAVSPLDSNVVYVGTESGGLWKSSDGGGTWQAVAGVPESSPVRCLVFDGAALYAASYSGGVYRITSEHCEKIQGSPPAVRRMAVADGALYMAGAGLYKYAEGSVSMLPVESGVSYISGLDARGQFIVISANTGNIMKFPLYYSTDGGRTWNNAFRRETHNSTIPWFRDEYFSSSTSCVAISWKDSRRVMLGDWHGIWMTEDITAGHTVWTNPMEGIEESVPFWAVSTPSGARLITALADTDGARYTAFDAYPENVHDAPRLMSTTSIDFCEEAPEFVARVGVKTDNATGDGGYSLDNGVTWNPFPNFPKDENGAAYRGGRIAVSARMQDNGFPVLLLLTIGGPAYRSLDGGTVWTEITDFPPGLDQGYWSWKARIVSDRTDGSRFYAATDTGLYRSDDSGVSWTKTAEDVLLSIKSDFGRPGALWGMDRQGRLFRSLDGGEHFEQIYGTSGVTGFDFGKGRAGCTSSAVYFCGYYNGCFGVFQSDDYGASFRHISAGAKNLYNEASFVTADRQEYGAVYIGTNGSGILRAEFLESRDEEFSEDFEKLTALPDTWECSGVSTVAQNQYNHELKLGAWSGSMEGKAVYKGVRLDNNVFMLAFRANNQGNAAGNICNVYFNYHDNSGRVSAYQLSLAGGEAGGAELRRIIGGKSALLAVAETGGANKNANYTVEYQDGRIRISRNGIVIIDILDEMPVSSGYFGFEAVNTVVNIDDIQMTLPEVVLIDNVVYSEGREVPAALDAARGKELTVELTLFRRQAGTYGNVLYSVFDSCGRLQAAGFAHGDTLAADIPAALPEGCALWLYVWDQSMKPGIAKIPGI